MTVNKELSVVADSTHSPSSPFPNVTTRTVKRTYGRAKMSDDPDTSLSFPPSSSASRNSTYRTGPPDLDEQVPPSSDFSHSFSDNELADDENEGSPQDAPADDFFGVKRMMRDYDATHGFDVDMSDIPRASHSEQPPVTETLSFQRVQSPHVPTSPAVAPSNALTHDLLEESPSTLTTSPLSQSAIPQSPSSHVGHARHRLKRRVMDGSDSESEPAGNKCTSATRSPAFPHAISTPKSRSSPTPPTSDDEMPAYPMQRHNSKGKGKANPPASRPTVAPLQFSEGPNGSSVGSKKSMRKDKRNKKTKIKPPTKKELKETRRDSARLAADQAVSIPRNGADTQKYTLQHFFTGLAGRTIAKEPSSDPIGEFSSPPKDVLPSINQQLLLKSTSMFAGCETSAFRSMTGELPRPSILKPMASLGDLDSDSDALPEVGELVSEEQKTQDQAHARYALLEKKKLLLAQQAEKRVVSDDDDDLEIMPPKEMSAVVKEEEAGRKSGKKRISEARKRQLNLGGIGLERQRVKGTSKDDALPFAISSVGRLKGNNASMTQGELNKSLVRRVMSVNEESTKKKEEEWVRRGGKVIDGTQDILSSANDASATYAEKGLQAAEERGVAMEVNGDDEDEGEGSDEDWMPEMRGSASPSPQPYDGEEGKEEDGEQAVEEEQEADITMVNPENEGATVDDDFDEKQILKVRPRRRTQTIVDSGDEGTEDPFSILKPKQRTFGSPQDDNNENAMLPISIPSTNHRGSLSSTDERTEDENDKENNTSLMFDHSENKENKAVVRHGDASGKHPLGARTSSLFGLELGIARRLSMSPVLHSQGIDADDEDDESEEGRSPLKDLLDDDPFQVTSSKFSTSFAVRLQQASPAATLPPDANLVPFIGKGDSYPHSPTDPSGIGRELLQPGFSDLFEAGTEKQKVNPFKRPAGFGLSESFSDEEPAFDKLRKPVPLALGLTQDVVLQPAFQIGDSLLRKADRIFEKEQGYLLEAASKKLQKEPTLYVNDHGFLTQTRPDAASPRVYIPPSPSQTLTLLNPLDLQSSERPPLRTLTLDKSIDFDSPDIAPLRRLRRGVPAPSRSPVADASHRFSPSLSPGPRKRSPNAFDVMISAAKATNEKAKRRLEKSEFVEAEAQESDDDEMFGFGGRKKDDGEEEDGEDLDKTLETLVDDQEMDEETVNAQLVHKKYQEHADQDDREIEKLHQAAIQGDLRKKKRNHGVGLDESDDNSDDEEKNRRIRRGMNKKPKIDRDNIRDLANFDETKAFFQVYEHSLVNNQNFEFLDKTKDSEDVDMGDKGQEEDEVIREYVTSAEIRRRVREQADEGEDEEAVDPHDVSWVDLGDASDGEGTIRVKSIDVHPRKQARSRHNGIDNAVPSYDQDPKPVTMPGTTIARMQHWAKVEGRSRNAGTTGRSVGGAAVTGHGRAKVKTGGGSLRSGSTTSVASTDSGRATEQRRPVKAMPSVLAGVAAERSARFG